MIVLQLNYKNRYISYCVCDYINFDKESITYQPLYDLKRTHNLNKFSSVKIDKEIIYKDEKITN